MIFRNYPVKFFVLFIAFTVIHQKGQGQVKSVPNSEAFGLKYIQFIGQATQKPVAGVSFYLESSGIRISAAETTTDSAGYGRAIIPNPSYSPKCDIVLTGLGAKVYAPVKKKIVFNKKIAVKDTVTVFLKKL